MIKNMVYGLFDPRDNSCFYIGQTAHGEREPKSYISNSRNNFSKQKVRRFIKSLMSNNIVPYWKLLEECQIESLDEIETFWISSIRAAGGQLQNVADGGKVNRGYKHSTETLKNISIAQKKRYLDPLQIEKNRNAQRLIQSVVQKRTDIRNKKRISMIGKNTGKKRTLEQRNKLSEVHLGQISWMRGKKHSFETREKISKSGIGKIQSLETIEKRVRSVRKKISVSDGNVFSCARLCAEFYSIPRSTISACARKGSSTRGLIFSYA